MSERTWRSIKTAPKDGSIVRVRRVYEGECIFEGDAVWGVMAPDAPSRFPMPPDPLGRPPFNETQTDRDSFADAPRWLHTDRRYVFPTPTHWKPRP